jgi:hypothetical protein
MVVAGIAAARSSSLSWSISLPVRVPATAMPMSWQTLPATVPLSRVMILTAMPRPASSATAAPASALGRSTNVRKPSSCKSRPSDGVGVMSPGAGARRNRDDAGAVVEEPSKHRLRLCRHVDAPREHCLGRTLRDERDARRRADDDGSELTLVVEWQEPEALECARARRNEPRCRRRRGDEREIEGVAADGTGGGHRRLVAKQAVDRVLALATRGIERWWKVIAPRSACPSCR